MGSHFEVIYTGRDIGSIHICTAGDDTQTLIWDLTNTQAVSVTGEQPELLEPLLTYKAEAEVTMLQWPIANPKWVCVVFNDKLQMLQV